MPMTAEAAGRWDPDDPGPTPLVRAVLRQAAVRRLSPRRGADGLTSLGEGAALCRIDGLSSDRTSFLAAQRCNSRWLVMRALTQAGLPVPRGFAAGSRAELADVESQLGWPVDVRPVLVRDRRPAVQGLADLASLAAARDRIPGGAVVSATAPGTAYRFVLVGGVLHSLTGPAAGGEPVALPLAAAHPLNRLLVQRAAAVCGIDCAMVELTTTDLAQPFTQTGAVITEVAPGFVPEAFPVPSATAADALAGHFLDYLFPEPADGHVPILLVGGPDGGRIARQVAHLCAARGRTVGLATRTGLSVAGLPLFVDDRRGRRGLPILVDHRSVEVAVVECDPDSLAGGGVGHDRADLIVDGDAAASQRWAGVPRLAATGDPDGVAALATRHLLSPAGA